MDNYIGYVVATAINRRVAQIYSTKVISQQKTALLIEGGFLSNSLRFITLMGFSLRLNAAGTRFYPISIGVACPLCVWHQSVD